MFTSANRKEYSRPPAHVGVPEPRDPESRLIHFVWTPSEDIILRSLYNQFGSNWQLIADIFNSSRITIPTDERGQWDCLKRYRALEGDRVVGGEGGPNEWGSPLSRRERERERERLQQQALGASNKKPPPQVIQARLAGGRRPLRHSIVFEVIKKHIIKRANKPPGTFSFYHPSEQEDSDDRFVT